MTSGDYGRYSPHTSAGQRRGLVAHFGVTSNWESKYPFKFICLSASVDPSLANLLSQAFSDGLEIDEKYLESGCFRNSKAHRGALTVHMLRRSATS